MISAPLFGETSGGKGVWVAVKAFDGERLRKVPPDFSPTAGMLAFGHFQA
ncbi:MAG: hypothetical protein AB7G28_20485 [Pirellulales bacterium]